MPNGAEFSLAIGRDRSVSALHYGIHGHQGDLGAVTLLRSRVQFWPLIG